MLHWLDDTLEQVVRRGLRLGPQELEVSFHSPDRDWSGGVNRPTLNLFLWDLRRNEAESVSATETVTVGGRTVHRPIPPRFDFRYLVTAWSREPRDEHQLLGSTLLLLARTTVVDDDDLRGALAGSPWPPPNVKVGYRGDERSNADFWSALQNRMKLGLDVVVTATVDPGSMAEAGPAVDRVDAVAARQR